MRKRFVLITGRHDDAFHRTARGHFSSARDASTFAEDACRRGEFDWWMVVDLDGERVAESRDGRIPAINEAERITTTADLESHGFLIPIESSSTVH